MPSRPSPSTRIARKPLPPSFYDRSAREVARELLGHWLLRRTSEGWMGGPIVETEAYLHDDPACHAVNGRTNRNSAMFGPPGRAYVYYIYGVHYCVNAVCMREGIGEAVLIRAIEPRLAPEQMLARRKAPIAHLSNGPGKLCAALDIGRSLNGADLCDPVSPLIIAADPSRPRLSKALGPIAVSPRIGISKAADAPLRFYLAKSQNLSRRATPQVVRPTA